MTAVTTPGSPAADGPEAARWLALPKAIRRLAAARTLDEVVEAVRDAARRLTGAGGIAFALREGGSYAYLAEDAGAALGAGRRVPLGEGVPGWAMAQGRTAVVPDIRADDRVPHDAYRTTSVRSMVVVPVAGGPHEGPVGAIGAYWEESREPQPDEVAILEALADASATAVANTRLVSSLRASDALQRAVVAGTPECIKIVAADGRLLQMNPAGLRMIEAGDPGSVDQACTFDLIAPEHRERWREMHARVCAGEHLDWEFDIVGLCGTRRRMETHAAPLQLPDGTVAQLAVTRDVTARKRAEDALRLERDRSRAVLDNLGDGYVLVDREFRVIEINPAGLAIERRPAHEIVGKTFWEAWPGVEESEAGRLWKEAMAQRAPRSLQHRYTWPGGRAAWLEVRAFPADDGLAFFFRDVEERKAAEAALAEREEHLVAIFAQAAAGMSEADATGRFLRVNDRFCAITGRSREELLSLRMHDITHPDDLPGNAPLFDRAARAGEAFEIEKRYVRPDGSIVWVHNSVTTLREPNGDLRNTVCVTVDISARKRAEEALRASNGRFRAAIEATNGVLWTNDPSGRMVGEQPGWAALTGQSFDEYQGYGWSDAVHPDDAQPTIDAWNEAVAERKTFLFEHRVRRHDGAWRLFAIRAIPILDDRGGVAEWVGVHTDVTEQRAAQEALREESHTLETLNGTGAALAAELDLERIVQRVTDAGVELTGAGFGAFFYNVLNEAGESYMLYTLSGVDRSAFEGFPMPRATAVFKPTFDGEGVIRSDDILADSRYGHTEPHRGMPKGHLPVRSYLAVPVASRSGEVVGGLFFGHPEPGRFGERHERLMVGIAAQAAIAIDNARLFQAVQRSNETLEQRVAEALAERRLLADIIDGTDVFVQVADCDFNWLAINQASAAEFARIFGTRRPKAGDNMLEMLRHRPADRAAVKAAWSRALAGEEFVEVEEFGDPLLDRRYYEMRFRALRGPDGGVVGAYQFVYDVTDRLREQARLRDAEEALRQAQKMEAMGQLTGGVAHDFNNLLTPIVGSLDMLQRKGLGGEREQRLIAGAMQSADRAKTLVQRLLAFARRQPLQPTSVDVGKLVQGMADLLASTSGPQIKLVVDTADGLPAAKADPNQLEMALLNLGVNARDAMPEGGTLRITATAETVGPGHRSKLKPGRYVRLSVADTGVGMSEATLARAVEPRFSTKGIGKGTGLGLSMVHGLAAQLGGALTIQSRLGVGTNVELWLPESAGPAEAPAEVADAAPAPSARGVALLVDDEELVRMSTADMLSGLGYAVTEARSAEEALHLLKGGLKPDLLVTDHLMPGMTGTDLARAVRAERPEMQVLVVSGYAETDGIAPDLPRLSKPFRAAELAASLGSLATGVRS